MSNAKERARARARRDARARRQDALDQERTLEIGFGGFLGAFLAVLAVGGAGLGAWWFLMGPGSGDQGAAPAPAAQAPASTSRVSAEIGAFFGPEGHPVLGSRQAPVTVVEYSDFQCPNCRQFALEVVPWLKESWLRQGLVRVEYRDFAIRGEASFRAAMAAQCAADQGRFWSYHDRLYGAFEDVGAAAFAPESLAALASEVGLDATALATCVADGRHRARVEASTREAHDQGFEGTPTYLIDGRQVAGAIEIADWEALFQAYAQELGVAPPAP